jgi:WD40 repeat protein
LSNGQVLETIEEKTPINDVAYSPSGKYLALASDEGIKVLDTITLQVVAQVSLSYPYCLAFSPDSNTLAVGLLDNNVILINANSGEIVDKFSGHTDAVHSIEFSPDGTLLASGAFDSTIRLWKINP